METVIMVVLCLFSIYDIRKYAIPAVPALAGLLLSVVYSVYGCVAGSRDWIDILCGLLPGAGMLMVARVTDKAGYGDGIVLMALGILHGFRDGLFLLCSSLLLLSLCSVILLAMKKVKGNSRMPYIPFLGMVYIMKWGAKLI